MEELKYHYKYPHPSVTTDCVIFGFDGTKLKVLLVERGIDPYKGHWAFPGGFLRMDETAEAGALRELQGETGLEGAYIKQFHTFSAQIVTQGKGCLPSHTTHLCVFKK